MNSALSVIEGVTPSAELRASLKGQTVLLAFSRGKDSIAAWLALIEAGVSVVPFHRILVPGLKFVDEDLAYWEDHFRTHIVRIPHPSLWRWLRHMVYQPPERQAVISAADIYEISYRESNAMLLEYLDLPETTWTIDGVRAADSPARRRGMATHGPVNERERQMHAVWDWRKAAVMDIINGSGARWPVDYQWFGRSFDGLHATYTGPLKQHAPDDYATVLRWFPFVDLELARYHLSRPVNKVRG